MQRLIWRFFTKDKKNQAVKLARGVEGVKSVTDYFLPKKKDHICGTAVNLKLSTKVTLTLIADVVISSTQIEGKTLQHRIILLVLVSSAGDINKAIAHAKSVEGARSVRLF
ncbi:MAG: BON domain-containing protein [Deltaproteobacteria bacterium]